MIPILVRLLDFMEERISIVCPSCRTKLFFLSVPNWQERLVECPHCHFKAKANVYQSGQLAQGGHGADDSATELPDNFFPERKIEIGVIKVKSTGRCHQLKLGTNVIGRVAQTGKADLKISTDPYMSRQHLQIDVVETPFGVEHRLVEIGAKNNIILNDTLIHRGDILVLKYGDRMILGKTEIVFDKPSIEDSEATSLI